MIRSRYDASMWLCFGLLMLAAPLIAHGAELTAGNTAVGTNNYFSATSVTMSRAKTQQFGANPTDDYGAMVVDPAGAYGYVYSDPRVASGDHPVISKIRLSDLAVTATLQLNNAGTLYVAVMDPNGAYAYFAGSVGVIKVRLADFTEVQRYTLAAFEAALGVAVINSAGTYAYFGSHTANSGYIIKVRLSDMTEVGAVPLFSGALSAAVIDPAGTYAYFSNNTTTNSGTIYKIHLSDLNTTAWLPLALGESGLSTAVIDSAGTYAYFGTNTSPAKVIKIRLSDLKEVGTLTLASDEIQLHSSAIDPAGRYAFFGTWTSPGKVVKIRLADFTEVETLTLNAGENRLKRACIDPAGQYAYFDAQSDAGDGLIVKTSLNGSGIGVSNAVRATRAVLPEPGRLQEVRFYSHQATGHLRLALYGDGANGENLLWQSPEITNTTSGGWISMPVASGTPASLTLPGGSYWLAFNTDASSAIASFTPGSAGAGFAVDGQPYGAFPSSLPFSGIQFLTDSWSEYLTYTQIPPTAPVSTWPDSITLNSIKWNWFDYSDNESGFKLFVDSGLTTPTTLQATAAANATSLTMTGLAPNTPYTCRVAATNNVGDATETNYAKAWTGIEPVAGLAFISVSETSIDVAAFNDSFTNIGGGSSGLAFANVTVGTNPNNWQSSLTPWTSKNLTPNTPYTFSGKSRNGVAIETTLVRAVRTTMAAQPSLGGNVSCGYAVFAWQRPGTTFTFSNPAGFGAGTHGGNNKRVSLFNYAWDTSPTYDFSGFEQIWSSGPLNCPTSGLGPYYLHLRSINSEGSANPNTLDLGPFQIDADPPTAPGVPTGPALVVGAAAVTFTWLPASDGNGSGVSYYMCQIGSAPGASDIFNGNAGGLSKTVNAPAGSTLYCRVQAVDAVGNAGPWSASSAGSHLNAPPSTPSVAITPSTPRKLDNVAAVVGSSDSDAGDSVVGYRYEWRLGGTVMSTSTTLASALLTKGQQWTLTAWAQDSNGDWSQPGLTTFTIANSPPTQPVVEVRPKPAQPGQNLIVDVQVYSTDPDGDEVAYDFNWLKSRDNGQTWIHKVELDGMPQVVGEYIQDGDLWEVHYIPYEKASAQKPAAAQAKPLASTRVEGKYGWDRTFVGSGSAPKISLATPLGQRLPAGAMLIVGWDFSDAAGDGCTVDLEWSDAQQLGYTPFATGLPARQGAFRGPVAFTLDRSVTIHGVIRNAKGVTAQQISAPVELLPPAPALTVDYLLGRTTDGYGLDANRDGKIDAADLVGSVAMKLPDIPAGPQPADAATGVANLPTLTWTASPYAQSYQLYLWPANTPRPATPAASGLTSSTYTIKSPLTGKTTYWWQVVATSATAPMPGPVWSFTTK